MSSTTTLDNGCTDRESVKQLTSDGFVLLGQLYSTKFVELVLDVSRRRAGA